jgi:polyhydroxyalkanoate synthesis regulator phasin
MIEIVKKTFMTGAGLAHEAWDEVEALTKEIVKKAKMSEKEGSKFLKDMKVRYDDTQNKLEKYVEKIVRDILKKMNLATADDIKALKKEIRQLKKAVILPTTKKSSRTTAARKSASSTTAKKRTRTTTAKKTAGRASTKKRTSTSRTKKRAGSARARKPAGKAAKKS